MSNDERKVLCTIEKGYSSERDDQLGKLRVYFEILSNNEIVPINSTELFCNTEQVFVTSGYSELKEKFGQMLFVATCVHSKMEIRDGDCHYVTRAESCEEIKGMLACHIYDTHLPSASNPTILTPIEPITRTIVIRENDFYFGPFEYTKDDEKTTNQYILNLKALNNPINKNIPPFHIEKVNEIKCIASTYEKEKSNIHLLANIKKIFDSADDKIDFITDEQLISVYGTKIAQSSEIRSFTKGTVTQIRKHYSTSKEYKAFPERFNRFFDALDVAEGWDGNRTELIESFLSKQKGKEILERYIEENRERFFQNEKIEYQKQLEIRSESERKSIEQLVAKKEEIEADIRKLVRERDEFEVGGDQLTAIAEESRNKIEQELSSQRTELDRLCSEVKSLEEKHNLYTTLEQLENKIKELLNERDMRYRDKQAMEAQVDEVAQKLKESNDKLTSRLVKLKPDVDALCGLKPKTISRPLDYHVETIKPSTTESNEDLREELIDSVLDALNNQGRKTDYYTAANILTTIAQCQFTLFSGLPGTGKTSLAKMLGNGLGLKNRFLNIPVARGWTSSRDIIGFYNALSQSFNSASTGLYELLKHLHDELNTEKDVAPAIVLLDEFNLSQPEHYFSPFLEMADPESKRILTTGDPDEPYLSIPKYLRFLGTINQDESVQGLTPRMLDRTAIINFDDFEHNYDLLIGQNRSITTTADIKPISGKTFVNIFTPTSLDLPTDIEVTLRQIIDKLRDDSPEFGSPVLISYRKIKAIRSYHNVAAPLMFENRYAALDYAVSQHILPLLNGYGESFGKRLDNVFNLIPDEMERSKKMLKRIIALGNHNLFSYGM